MRKSFFRTDQDPHTLPFPSEIRRFGQEVRPVLFQVKRESSSQHPSLASLPGGRGPRRRGFKNRVGKLIGRSPSAAGLQQPPSRPAQLGMIIDECSQKCCLLDTGSQVSLWPPSPSSSKLQLSCVRLTAANGTPIKAFGQQTKLIKISGKSYSFVFLIAQVSRPILGLDFLQTFEMAIDLCKRQLIDSGTSTRFSSASSEISGVNIVRSLSSFLHALQEFPEITDALLATSSSRHRVECFINTTKPHLKDVAEAIDPPKNYGSPGSILISCAPQAFVNVRIHLGAQASTWWPRRTGLLARAETTTASTSRHQAMHTRSHIFTTSLLASRAAKSSLR